MRLVSRALLTLSLLAAPAVGWACGACVDSQVRFIIPTYYWCVLVLAIWGLYSVVFTDILWTSSSGSIRIKLLRIPAFCALAFGLLLLGMGSLFLIGVALGALYLLGCYRMFRGLRESRLALILTLLAGVLLLSLVGLGIAQRAHRDLFDNALATVSSGTASFRSLVAAIGKDQEFDIERLRPLIREENGDGRAWAFAILRVRKNKMDLDLFFPELATLPKGYFKEREYPDSGAMDFRMWIDVLDLDLEDLERRVEEGQSADPVTPSS